MTPSARGGEASVKLETAPQSSPRFNQRRSTNRFGGGPGLTRLDAPECARITVLVLADPGLPSVVMAGDPGPYKVTGRGALSSLEIINRREGAP